MATRTFWFLPKKQKDPGYYTCVAPFLPPPARGREHSQGQVDDELELHRREPYAFGAELSAQLDARGPLATYAVAGRAGKTPCLQMPRDAHPLVARGGNAKFSAAPPGVRNATGLDWARAERAADAAAALGATLADAPRPSRAPVAAPTPAPTADAPAPTCADDAAWKYVGKDKKRHTCAWVAEEPARRCRTNLKDGAGRTPLDACPGSCGTCPASPRNTSSGRNQSLSPGATVSRTTPGNASSVRNQSLSPGAPSDDVKI